MNKKRILFVSGTLSNGGAERVLSSIANKFSDKNHEVTIVTLYNDDVNYPINKEINVVHLVSIKENRIMRFFNTVFKLRSFIKSCDFDIMISFLSNINIYSLISKVGIDIPIIISERNDPNREPATVMRRFARNFIYRFADGVIFQTEDAKSYFSKKIQSKSTIILNPLFMDMPTYSFEKTKNKICTVSRLSNQKNLKLLINSFSDFSRTHKDYTLDIYGDGEERHNLEEHILSQKIKNVTFHGFTENVHSQIIDSKIFVLSSDYEGLPNALIESLCIGIPCIATDSPIGGCRFLIDNGVNGLLIEPGNKEQLVNGLEMLVNDGTLRENFSRESIKMRSIFNLKNIYNEWVNFVEKTIK